MKILRIPCLFDAVFKMYCPGCGGTRALMALLGGHFLKALWYHPLVPYCAVVCGGLLLSWGLRRWKVWGAKRMGSVPVRAWLSGSLPAGTEGGIVSPWKFHSGYLWAGLAILAVNWVGKNILRLWFGILM